MKTCFSEGRVMKQFGNPLFLKVPPFQLIPLFLSNFFMTPLFVQISKTRPPPPPPNFRGRETMQKGQINIPLSTHMGHKE